MLKSQWTKKLCPLAGNFGDTSIDANNRTGKTVTGGDGAGLWTYAYNDVNQLLSWAKRAAANGLVLKEAELAYDAKGNRVQTLVGNSLRVRLRNGGSKAPMSASVAANDIVVKRGGTDRTW